MISCRSCRKKFKLSAEQIGARCPNCRRPLFEKPARRFARSNLGACAIHPENNAVTQCRRCGALVCATCQTRMDDVLLCPACVEEVLDGRTISPHEERGLASRALHSLHFSLLGWISLICCMWVLHWVTRENSVKEAPHWVLLLFLSSWIPPLFALAQSMQVIRQRGKRLTLATIGLAIAGTQLGLMVGLVFVNLWNN